MYYIMRIFILLILHNALYNTYTILKKYLIIALCINPYNAFDFIIIYCSMISYYKVLSYKYIST